MASSDAGPSDQHGEGMDMDGWWRKNTRQVAKRFLGEGSGSDRSKCFGERRAMEGGCRKFWKTLESKSDVGK